MGWAHQMRSLRPSTTSYLITWAHRRLELSFWPVPRSSTEYNLPQLDIRAGFVDLSGCDVTLGLLGTAFLMRRCGSAVSACSWDWFPRGAAAPRPASDAPV